MCINSTELPELFWRNREAIMNMARRKPEASGKIYEIIQNAKNAYHRNKGTTFTNRDGMTLDYWQLNEAERMWREAIEEASAKVKSGTTVVVTVVSSTLLRTVRKL